MTLLRGDRLTLRLHADNRISTENRYVLSTAERLVLVPDEIRKCVAFAAYDRGNGPELCGTVFIIGLPYTDVLSARFAVTAAHILDEVEKRSIDGKLHLRFNRRGGGFIWVETALRDWMRHPTDPAVDCAIILLPLPEDADQLMYRITGQGLDDEVIEAMAVGVGDDVFFPGLFVKHAGVESNVPIVRTGTIAAMRTRAVQGGRGPMEAYLIEARSIGGLSGSPAFVQVPRATAWGTGTDTLPSGQLRPRRVAPFFFFMGLIHGHWNVQPIPDEVGEDALSDEVVNMGIAIVVPADLVMEVIQQPAVTAIVDELKDRARASRQAVGDAAP